MYKALYAYKSNLPQYLSFEADDKFTLLDSSRNDWYFAQNGFGQLGYIPANYIEKINVPFEVIIHFIDGSIEAIHYEAASAGVYNHNLRETLEQLVQHRKAVFDQQNRLHAENIEKQQDQINSDFSVSVNSVHTTGNNSDTAVPEKYSESSTSIPSPDTNEQTARSQDEISDSSVLQTDTASHEVNAACVSPSPNQTIAPDASSSSKDINLTIPSDLGAQLVDEIRASTQLNYKKSKMAVEIVVGYIGLKVPQLADVMDKIYATVESGEGIGRLDKQHLEAIFSDLREMKNDAQQRGWALHEDEAEIKQQLTELLSLLTNAKFSVTRSVISCERYESVHDLVEYYQMETRTQIRLLLLKVFEKLCELDRNVITILLFSVLPLEVAQELRSQSHDVERLLNVTVLMTVLFSTGEAVPANLHDHINQSFISYVLGLIEDPPSPDHSEDLIDQLISLVLAINLHFDDVEHNLVMKTLANQTHCKVLTEKILMLFNRGDDPVRLFDDRQADRENSVIKFMQDLYSTPQTASLLYTSDSLVLIDVLIRQLTNLSPGDPDRTIYLKLTRLVIENSNYKETRYRYNDLYFVLHSISEEDSEAQTDKDLSQSILQSASLRDI